MTSSFALEYIRRRAEEIGIGKAYFLKWRHLVLAEDEVRQINAGDDIYLLINELPNLALDFAPVRIESEFGIYDLSEAATNELIHEHRGQIRITNLSGTQMAHLQFIQIIPQNSHSDGKL